MYYAWGASGPLVQRSGTSKRFYAQDRHGDLAAVFDTAGVATGTLSYDPWGTPTAVGVDATASLLGYQSQPTDPTTGLVDMGARLYDPAQARFTTQDTLFGPPTNPLTLNQYIYAGDSPLDNSDPSGNSFACGGKQCDAATTVKYHAIQAFYEAENRGQPAQAAAYLAQAVNWLVQAAATPAPSAKAPTPEAARALPMGWTYRSNANGPGVHGSGNYCVTPTRSAPSCFSQPAVPATSFQHDAIGGFNILALALTPFTDGASDEVAFEVDAAVGSGDEVASGARMFRAVEDGEAKSIRATGEYRPSPTGSAFKGFYASRAEAQGFANAMNESGFGYNTVTSALFPPDLLHAVPTADLVGAERGTAYLEPNESLPRILDVRLEP